MVAVGDLSGSGGTERQFADLFRFLHGRHPGQVALISARASVGRLRAAGRLPADSGVIALPLGAQPARGWAGIAWMTLRLLWTTLGRGFDVVHLCQPTPIYVPYAAILTSLPKTLRPRLVMTVVDCTLAHNLVAEPAADRYERQVVDAHRWYSRWTRLDGVYSWYRAFVAVAAAQRLFPVTTVMMAARYCFTDTARFTPAPVKENLVVHVGRLSVQKRPLLFVDAVASLRERYPDLAAAWRFEMFGGGPLEAGVRQRIAGHRLDDILTLSRTLDMSPILARSRVFVSTQAFENFTSLAMLEAMAAANAIIAEDLGQTNEFVHHGSNGLLVRGSSPEAYADAIAACIRDVESADRMGLASRDLATSVHTIEHFADDLTSFWHDVLAGRVGAES